MKPSHLLKAFIPVFLVFLLSGCSGKYDLAKHLAEQEPIDYTGNFNKNLPYKRLVKAIHLQDKRSLSEDEFKEYSDAIYIIHKEAMLYTLNELNIPIEIKQKVLNDLQQNKKELANYYLENLPKNEYFDVYDKNKNKVISYPYYTSVEKFAEVTSQEITFIVNTFMGFVTNGVANNLTLAAVTKPFQIILYHALMPITEKLRDYALLLDHINARISIKSHLRKMIAQLATVEDKFETREEIHPTRKFLFITSQADIICESTAIVKAGFDLSKKFIVDIDPTEKMVKVYLPEPEIISFDIRTKFRRMNDGFLIDVNEKHINELQRLLRDRLEKAALQSGLLRHAKRNARNAIDLLLTPMMETPYFRYKISIIFG